MTELCKRVLASNLSAEDKVAILNALMNIETEHREMYDI